MQITTKMIRQIISEEVTKARKSRTRTVRLSKDLVTRLVREELGAMLGEEEEVTDQKGSEDEVKSAKDQDMKKDVENVAKFMFKHPQLSKALQKIKGSVEAGQLLQLLSQELGIEPNEISTIAAKAKKGMADTEDEQEVKEGRYHRTPYQGDDPRAQAFDQAITILDDQVFDSLEGDVAEYADEAVRALSKAIDELEYQRNTVGNLGDAEKQAIRGFEASQGKED